MKKKGESSNNIWVLILEKAWAKVFGNYAAIDGGSPYEVFRYITGCPVQNFSHSNI
jgi:calpain-15